MIYHLYLVILALCFLCSLISFRLHYPFHLKLFSVFLGISLVTEILGIFWIKTFHFTTNYPLYSGFMLLEYILYSLFFRSIIQRNWMKKVINAFLFIFPVVWTVTTFQVFGLQKWNSYVSIFGDAFTISMCVVYLHQAFVSEELMDFRRSPEFWIAAATVIYSTCEIPITGILNYLTVNYQAEALLLESVLQILNSLMYTIIIYAYLCRLLTNTTKYS